MFVVRLSVTYLLDAAASSKQVGVMLTVASGSDGAPMRNRVRRRLRATPPVFRVSNRGWSDAQSANQTSRTMCGQ